MGSQKIQELCKDPIFSSRIRNEKNFLLKKKLVLLKEGLMVILKNKEKWIVEKKRMIPFSFFSVLSHKRKIIEIRFKYSQIRTNEKILLHFIKKEEMEDWIDKAEQIGGIFIPKISKKVFTKWKSKDVRWWLSQLNLTAKEKDKLKDFNGKQLQNLDEEKLQNLGIKPFFKKRILEHLEILRSTQVFDYSSHKVAEKIKKITKNANNQKKIDWRIMAKCLSNKEYILSTYLNLNISKKIDLYTSPYDFQIEESKVYDPKYIRFGIVEYDFLSTRTNNKAKRKTQTIFSPVLKDIQLQPAGNFIKTYKFGKITIQLNPNGLIVPKNTFLSRIPESVFDTDYDYYEKFLIIESMSCLALIKNKKKEEIYKELAEFIVLFNSTKGRLSNSIITYFQVLMSLKIKGIRASSLSYYEKSFHKIIFAQNKYWFYPSKEFIVVFELSVNEIPFKNHKELSDFVDLCQSKNAIAFQMDFKTEYQCLRNIDLFFWHRHILLGEKEPQNCHFEDPRNFRW